MFSMVGIGVIAGVALLLVILFIVLYNADN